MSVDFYQTIQQNISEDGSLHVAIFTQFLFSVPIGTPSVDLSDHFPSGLYV